jgi:hypothetical protein
VRDHFGVVGGFHVAAGAGAIEGAMKCAERTIIHGIDEFPEFVPDRGGRSAR